MAERERLSLCLPRSGKRSGVNVDSLRTVLGSAHRHQIPLFQPPELPDSDGSILIDGHAVHSALFG